MMQAYKYGFLNLVRNKSLMFWTLAFPLILGTFFKIAFGGVIATTETFSQIPVAIAAEDDSEASKYFLEMAENLSQGDDALLSPQYVGIEEAKKLLSDGVIDGIFQIDDEISLIVAKQGLNQSVLKSISDSYLQISSTVNNVARISPDLITQTIENLSDEIKINNEITLGKGETDTFLQYYYALIAMACMYGSTFGFAKVKEIQANMSSIAARRCVSPGKKITMILSDFAAAVTLQFLEVLIVLVYLVFCLGINFGEQWGFVVLASFVGTIAGVSYGIFIASVVKLNSAAAEGLLSMSSLFLCFLSGLMYGNMKNIIERNAPVINRINPAALLSDAFYCLTVYDNYSRYTQCIISLLVISAVFCGISAFVLRRKKYANI